MMAGKKIKMADLLLFFAFYLNNILCKFVMHVTNKQFSDKFNNGRKKIKNGPFIAIFRLFLQ